uniref:Polypeptide N-acetylgalactosaminyltransferase 18 n=1 Tax=Molossus molossus TaxID=27622 RepID=A0A7J8ERF4_MOLMO|nr:polypeptide N-acetylgalactosaminyltransferase 18 [Molossus molossus]
MVCTRKTKTLVSTCVILSGMTNIICLLYVGWVTNYIASVYVRGQEPAPDKKLEEDKGDTLKIIERLDHLENVIKQHIQGHGVAEGLDFLDDGAMEEEFDVMKGGISRGQNSCVISPFAMMKVKGREASRSSLSPPAADQSPPASLGGRIATWLSTGPGGADLLCDLGNLVH